MALSVGSALEPNCQFLKGYSPESRVGDYDAPATATDQGTVVKLDTDGVTLAVCTDQDGQYMLEQAVDASGPTGSAANREKWLQGIPQSIVLISTKVSVQPIKSGCEIRTSKIATGTETGAVTAASITPGVTLAETYNGIFRVRQGTNDYVGIFMSEPDANGRVRILFV